MLPRVIIHNAVSADGRIDRFTPDVGQFYTLAAHWQEDATLAGSDTLLAAYPSPPATEEHAAADTPEPESNTPRPLLVVPDSRGRVRFWHQLLREPYWRSGVALCSRATPHSHLAYLRQQQIDYLVAGDDYVDCRLALEELHARYAVQVVRVDSGGTLNGVLLRAGLVDEVSVVIYPSLVGGTTPRSLFRAPDLTSSAGVISLKLLHEERLEGDTIWLRYAVEG
ncbi:MAG: deaminase [Dehalococcoidia bacterium]|nr:deaminase [Dehalococcoidia bacterium]